MNQRLNNEEASRFLGFSRNTLNNSRTIGLLGGVKAPRHRKVGKKILYERQELEAWLEQFELQCSTSDNAA